VRKVIEGVEGHNHNTHQHHKLGGIKVQQFLCCGDWCSGSPFVLFPIMLIVGEMGDKTQITGVSLAPNYGFNSIVIGGVVAQFLNSCIAVCCGAVLTNCIRNSEHWMKIFSGILFIAFGLYEAIGELYLENSVKWAERDIGDGSLGR